MRAGFVGWIFVLCITAPLFAFDWISLMPNSAYSRDLAMGASTLALPYAPQSQSINPAGLICFPEESAQRVTLFLNPGGMWQTKNYFGSDDEAPQIAQQVVDVARLITGGAAFRHRLITVAGLWSQPVMHTANDSTYGNFESRTPLSSHQNSLVVNLILHPRVSVGARLNRFYRGAYPEGESISYGAILKPRGVRVGLHYQRFPGTQPRPWHILDRRVDAATSAGLAADVRTFTFSFEMMNLTESGKPAFLEPHGGIEWRPLRALALRGGAIVFSHSRKVAVTTGLGLIDANWLRSKATRLSVPDDVIQFALAIVYDAGRPVTGISSLTVSWRL